MRIRNPDIISHFDDEQDPGPTFHCDADRDPASRIPDPQHRLQCVCSTSVPLRYRKDL
jgi:hypothetical protein